MIIPSFVFAQGVPNRVIWRAGDMTVTIVQDLPGEMPASIFSGTASEQIKLKYFTNGKSEAGINAFLLQVGGKIVLFDSGTGTSFQSPGKLAELLKTVGIKPEDVDYVLLTHLHLDHIGGLLQKEKRTFPNAKLMVSKIELESWIAIAENNPSNADEVTTASAALVKSMVTAYGADIQPFVFGNTLLPGVTALDASGHTPGHTAFQLKADGKNLLIVGDLIHSMPLQFALPDECASYDMNPTQAVLSRKRIFTLAAKDGMHLTGAHFPFANAVGMVSPDGKGWKFVRTQ